MAEFELAESHTGLKYCIRSIFGASATILLVLAITHFTDDGLLFEYDYISSADESHILRRILSTQQSKQGWNDIMQSEFKSDRAELSDDERKSFEKINEMLTDDRKAIVANAKEFHETMPQYIMAKREEEMAAAALRELQRKLAEKKKQLEELEAGSKKEHDTTEKASESGNDVGEDQKTLDKELGDEIARERKETQVMEQLMKEKEKEHDQWAKKAQDLKQKLATMVDLDKTNRALEGALERLVYYAAEKKCDWDIDKPGCAFSARIDVGLQFDASYFVVNNPPKEIRVEQIDLTTEAKDGAPPNCRIRAYVGVNELCEARPHYTPAPGTGEPTKDAALVPREICETTFGGGGCRHCNEVDFDLKQLAKELFPTDQSTISSFCVILKRAHGDEAKESEHCHGGGRVKLGEAADSGDKHVACPATEHKGKPPHHHGHHHRGKKKKKKKKKKKEKGTGKEAVGATGSGAKAEEEEEDEAPGPPSFAWRQIVGIWPYAATVLTVAVGVASFYILII